MRENSIIDWVAFGVLLKASRLKNGYSRGLVLAAEIEQRTGMKVSERTIYAIEEASRAPSADIFLALQQVLPELNDPEFLKPLFRQNGIKVAIVELRDDARGSSPADG